MRINCCTIAWAMATLLSAGPLIAQTYETSFEDLTGETEFFIGPAHFTGGIAQTIGVPAFYSDGLRAWMIDGQGTGLVDFGPGALDVSFQARGSADGDLVITPLDAAGGDPVGSPFTVSGTDFVAVDFTAQSLGQPITHLSFENTGAAGNFAAVDEFAFTAIPEPATWTMCLIGMLCAASVLLFRPQSCAMARVGSLRRK